MEKTSTLNSVCNPAVYLSGCLCTITSQFSRIVVETDTQELELRDPLEESYSPKDPCSTLTKILVNFEEQLAGNFLFMV